MFFSIEEYLVAGIGITVLAFCFGRMVGFTVFFTFGCWILLSAWTQHINYDGSWPKDQPYQQYYTPTHEEDRRLWGLVDPIDKMTKQDWDDYHRCRQHNVCVRRFAR